MKKILISLVSDQTIPNVLFIKEYYDVLDFFVFVTTEQMEEQGKLDWILKATGITKEQYHKAVVVEDELTSIENALNRLPLNQDDTFVLNLTGGTKIMTIGVYNYFLNKNSKIFYIPIGKNVFRRIFPDTEQRDFKITYRTDLLTYLTSYGIEVLNHNEINSITKKEEFTLRFFEHNYSKNRLLKRLFNHKSSSKRETCQQSEIPELFEWLVRIGFPFEKDGRLTTKETFYLLGGWLEEFTYTYFKKHLGLSDSAIGLNVRIKRKKVSNEFDVMFVYENAIYVIECKTGLTQKASYENAVYKLAALRKDFGLFVRSYILTMTEVKAEVWKNRAALFNIQLLDNLSKPIGKSNLKNIVK